MAESVQRVRKEATWTHMAIMKIDDCVGGVLGVAWHGLRGVAWHGLRGQCVACVACVAWRGVACVAWHGLAGRGQQRARARNRCLGLEQRAQASPAARNRCLGLVWRKRLCGRQLTDATDAPTTFISGRLNTEKFSDLLCPPCCVLCCVLRCVLLNLLRALVGKLGTRPENIRFRKMQLTDST